jgi:anthranilate phosphoribosyltransferase
MAAVLARLGTEHAVVVHGTDGIGEISLAAPTEVIEVRQGALAHFTWRPEDFGLAIASHTTMRVADTATSAAIVRRVLDGEPGPPRDIVVLNAAAALWTAGVDPSPSRCAQQATAAIDGGAARALLQKWAELSRT